MRLIMGRYLQGQRRGNICVHSEEEKQGKTDRETHSLGSAAPMSLAPPLSSLSAKPAPTD